MPGTRAIEPQAVSLPNSPQKTCTFTTRVPTHFTASPRTTLINERLTVRQQPETIRKAPPASKSRAPSVSQPLAARRSNPADSSTPRGRSNTDVQSVQASSHGLKQQQHTLSGSGSDKSINHSHQQRHTPPPPKPECTLPSSGSRSDSVTPSKLFNMMGYGLDNQYLFMQAHYLYLIDCRSKEEFNQSHIITGKRRAIFPSTETLVRVVRGGERGGQCSRRSDPLYAYAFCAKVMGTNAFDKETLQSLAIFTCF